MNKGGWVRRLWGYMVRHRRHIYLAIGAALGGSAAQAVVPLVARQILDNVIVAHRSSLGLWLGVLVGLGVVVFGFAYLRRYHGGRVALDVQFDLRNEMHDHLQSLDFTTLDTMPTGQLVARANSDSTLVQGLLSFLPIMSGNVLLMISSLVIMLVLSPLLAVVSLVVAPALLVVAYRMREKIFPASWDAQQQEGEVAQIVDEDVNGVRVVKAFGQERRELERLCGSAQTLYGSRMRTVRLQARYQPVLQSIPAVGQVAVLALGGYLALEHRISIGTFLAFTTYLTQLVAPARTLAGILTVGQQARAGVERIFQLLDLEPRITDMPGAVAPESLEGEIVFESVSFAYSGIGGDGPGAGGATSAGAGGAASPGAIGATGASAAPRGRQVLRQLDLHIAPGETLALVGASGSGKSSIVNLIPRFYDVTGGRVLVDGRDVRSMKLQPLRRRIGVVFEESFLFSDTVRANIAYGNPEATDEQIRRAARLAQANAFIEALPGGYGTVVGERGLSLSGGQRQRVALARALLTEPDILLLDDATSAVDARTEELIHDGLRAVMSGRTVIVVAHRRSTLRLADRIAVVADGSVADQGTHDELAARSVLYRNLLEGAEAEEAQSLEASIEALAAARSSTDAWAWERAPASAEATRAALRSAGATKAAPAGNMGVGLRGGGGSHGGWRMNLAPTPELLDKVANLPPVRDEVRLDLENEASREVPFTLRRLLRRYKRPLSLGLLLVVADALAGLAGPVLVKIGVDKGVATGSKAVLFAASAVFLAVTAFDLADSIAETFVTGGTAERLMLTLRVKIFAQLQRLSLDYYESEMAGRIMTRMTTDVDQFESLLENGLLSALVSLCTFVGVGAVLLVMNATLALCTLSVVIPLAVATHFFRAKAVRIYESARDAIAVVNAAFQESLSGVRESQAFVHETASAEHFHQVGRNYLEARLSAQRLVATYFPFVAFLSDGADAIVLGVGAGLIAAGHLSVGVLIAFVLYVDMFFSPIQQLSQVFDSWQQTKVSVGRIGGLMALDTLTPVRPGAPAPGIMRGELVLEGVHFSYPGSAGESGEALGGVDLHLSPGSTTALVGETGAGKSTVMKLLARFYDPLAGRVVLDGSDLRDLDLEAYRRRLGYVPQEAFLFTGTIRDNIAYGRPEASDADVEGAARAVGAHELIAGLPGGYLHVLSERGRSLSSGERQLIALARAELVDPAVLLLDEATSNLDLGTEARVARAMREVARGRTAVIIAHRLQTAREAERIVVLHDGRVAEEGSHEELVGRGGRYAEMWGAFDVAAKAGP
ncbi:MAG: ABC transporter ATP-binding protein [Acidimicrobiales bacterium]